MYTSDEDYKRTVASTAWQKNNYILLFFCVSQVLKNNEHYKITINTKVIKQCIKRISSNVAIIKGNYNIV